MTPFAASLSRASLAGRPFHVASDDVEAGRRKAVHTIPNGGHVVEEFGPAPRTYRATAYCGGLDAAAQARSLLDLDGVEGPHLLVLPTISAMVSLSTVKRAFQKDKLGYVAVDIECVDAGEVSAPGFGGSLLALPSIAALENMVFAAVDDVLSTVADFAVDLVGGLPAIVGDLSDALVSGALGALADLEIVRDFEAAVGVASDATAADVATFAALADDLADLAAASWSIVADPADWAASAASIVRAVADASDPVGWPTRAAGLVAVTLPSVSLAVSTPRSRAVEAASTIAARIVSVASLATFAEAAVRRSYGDRPSAVAARATLATTFADVIEDLAGLSPPPLAAIRSLVAVRDRTVVALRARSTTLAPVVTITSSRTRPALAWAWDLYADPTRAAEIAARNRLDHPGFVPETFEALAA
jgi:prophage DNA circulation protein